MNKFFLSIIVALGFCTATNAQDEMIFNHYIINPVIVNPAATGANGGQNFFLHYNNQWSGFPNTPTTFGLNYNGAVGQKLGLGAWISSENVAYQNRFRALLSYSFRFKINDFKGALGLSTEFKHMGLNSDVLSNPLYKAGDGIVELNADGVNLFDATMGFYGTYQDKLTIGLSMPNLVQAKLGDVGAVGSGDSNGGFKYYTFMLGYKHRAGAVTVEPSIMLKRLQYAPYQVDMNLKASFLEERVIGGVSYRAGAGGGFGVMIGTKYHGTTFAYSYGYALNRFQAYSNGSHELTLGYTLFPKKKSNEDMMIERTGGNYSN